MIGNCFYYQTPPRGAHLFVVVAPSLEQPGWFVCVNITTLRPGSDTSCQLLQGEHQELAAPVSVVLYAETRELPPPLISRSMQEQNLPKMSDLVLLRIQQSALQDDSRMKKKFQRAIQEYLTSRTHPN
jgi:hypothetical protein